MRLRGLSVAQRPTKLASSGAKSIQEIDRLFSAMPEPDRSRKLCPYPSRCLAHPLELTSFGVDGKAVSNDRGGKAALSAERQAFQRHKAICLRDATDEVFRRLHLRPLGADQSEDHHLVVGDVPERCKRAGPIAVVFEEKPRCTDAPENRSGKVKIIDPRPSRSYK